MIGSYLVRPGGRPRRRRYRGIAVVRLR